ncbi:MAG TPA: hypothetical protein VK762_20255 [Polyangiaceae bacterium]|nr:hypothetical protein [Polyangiaceae bacterium]
MRNMRHLAEKKTWTEEDGQHVVDVWRASGQSIAAFAREQGIGDGRLRWWRDRVSDAVGVAGGVGASRGAALVEGPRLVRVDIEESSVQHAHAGSAGAWELVTPHGRLRVHDGIGVSELRLVLEALVVRDVAP